MISGSGAQPCEAGNVTVSRQTSLQLLSERPSTETCTLSGECGFCIRAFCEVPRGFSKVSCLILTLMLGISLSRFESTALLWGDKAPDLCLDLNL